MFQRAAKFLLHCQLRISTVTTAPGNEGNKPPVPLWCTTRMLGANKPRLSSPGARAREIQSAPGSICSLRRGEKGGFRRLGAQTVVVARCSFSMSCFGDLGRQLQVVLTESLCAPEQNDNLPFSCCMQYTFEPELHNCLIFYHTELPVKV